MISTTIAHDVCWLFSHAHQPTACPNDATKPAPRGSPAIGGKYPVDDKDFGSVVQGSSPFGWECRIVASSVFGVASVDRATPVRRGDDFTADQHLSPPSPWSVVTADQSWWRQETRATDRHGQAIGRSWAGGRDDRHGNGQRRSQKPLALRRLRRCERYHVLDFSASMTAVGFRWST